jgi:hypothetical protein
VILDLDPLSIFACTEHYLISISNGIAHFKNVNNCLNIHIYSYLETSGGQNSNLHLNVAHFFNTSVNVIFVAAYDSCFPALVSNMCSPILHLQFYFCTQPNFY